MDIFYVILQQVLTMFIFMVFGYALRKAHILPESSDVTMARLETYIFVPALSLSNLLSNCSVETFTENFNLILYGTVIVAAAVAAAYPLSRLFIRKANTPEAVYQRNIYKYAMTFGNYGFMGNFIVLGIWGDEVFFRYQMFYFIISIVCNSWGLYILIPKEKNAGLVQNLKKGLLAPPVLALVAGILLGLIGAKRFIPTFLLNVLSDAGKCQGPVAMILAGFVIGGYKLKSIIWDKKVFGATILRLIVIPAIMMIVLHLLGVSKEIMLLTLICFATPLGLNTIVYPAAYGGDTKTGACMTTISSLLFIITIPVMYLVFITLI